MTPPGDPLDPAAVAGEIDREIRALPAQGVQPVRVVRRAWSRRLRAAPAEAVADRTQRSGHAPTGPSAR